MAASFGAGMALSVLRKSISSRASNMAESVRFMISSESFSESVANGTPEKVFDPAS